MLTVLLGTACAQGDTRAAEIATVRTDSAASAAAPGRPPAVPDSVRLAAVVDRAAELPRLRSLLVSHQGELLAERYFRGATPERRANVKSVSKSIVSALVGIAIQQGHLRGVDQPLADFYPELRSDSAKREITIGNLLSMQAGLEGTSFGNYGRWVSSPNWVRFALNRPMDDAPGGRMIYSTGNTHLLSAVLTRATGQSTWSYAQKVLFEPLDINLGAWPTDPQGIFFGGNDMRLTPRQMVRFGELYRNGGAYGGRQIVPAAWIQESWRPRTVSPWNGHRYGLGWWSRPAGQRTVYFAWGYGGQYIFVIPDLDLTIVATSDPDAPSRDGGHLRAIHRMVDEEIIPAIGGS